MPAERFPRAIWKGDGYSTGSYTGGPWKCVLHTTETSGVPSYNDGRSTPHVTYFPRERKFYQHLNFSQPARALRDAEGGVATIMADEFFNVYDKTGPGMSNYKP